MEPGQVAQAFDAVHWGNTTETAQDWVRILGDPRDERREDGRGLWVKVLFPPDEWLEYLRRLNKPYHRPDVERRRKVWRSVYLNEEQVIPGLTWASTVRRSS